MNEQQRQVSNNNLNFHCFLLILFFFLIAIGCTFNQLGNAGGFFLGPLIVKQPDLNQSREMATEIIKISIRNYMWIGMLAYIFIIFLY